MSRPDRSFGGGQLVQRQADESGLPFAVASHEGYLFAPLDDDVRARKDVFLGLAVAGREGHARLFGFDDHLSRTRGRGKPDVHRRIVFLFDFDAFDLVELFDARLHLVRFGRLVAEFFDEFFGLFDHPLLVFIGGDLLLAPFGPQFDVAAVRHFVVGGPPAGDLDGAVGDVIEECPVVRNEDHRPAVLQVGFQPLDALDVEVVGRLVEQEQGRALQKQFRQLDAHAPPARKGGGGAVELLAFETQSQQGLFDLGVAVVPVQQVVSFGGVVEPVEQFFVFGRFVVGAGRNFGRAVFDLLFEGDDFGESLAAFRHQVGIVGHAHLLGQVADGAVFGFGHGARGRRLQARDDFQQGRFAGSVLADQPDALFGIDQERNVAEQVGSAERNGQIIYG